MGSISALLITYSHKMVKLIVCCLTLSFVTLALADPLPSNYGQQFRFRAAPEDTISQYFDSRQRRSDGGSANKGLFTRALRRTLPFQLVPQPPLAYARSNSYVGEPEAIEVATSSAAATEDNFEVQRNYKPSREASASEILSMLEDLTNRKEGKT